MIIYGSRMYGVKNVVYSHGVCNHCGNFGKHRSYNGRKWGHIYFIPLFPLGDHARVLKECGRCKMGQQLPAAEADRLYKEIEVLIEPCVIAACQGEHTFTPPNADEPADTASFLTSAIEMLYVTGHGPDIPGILQMLRDDGADYEYAIALSTHLDLQGQGKSAQEKMQEAADALPDAPYPQTVLAAFAARIGQPEAQLEHLKIANDLADGDNVPIMLTMAGPLEALQRYGELSELLDRCIALVPELGQDKKFTKLQKKYAKKASKQR